MHAPRSPRARWLPAGLLAGLFALGGADATEFRIDPHGLSPQQVQATRELLQASLDLLPPYWRQSLPQRLDVQWRDDLREQVQARALSRGIVLDRDLLQRWSAGDRSPGGDGRVPLAAVVHELAHFHDRSPRGGLSRDPRLLDQAGWLRGRWHRAGANTLSDRSPDDYERHSSAEFVAVNLEYFVLDPQYRCRRPQLHGYFAAHFGMPGQSGGCPATLPFVQAGSRDGEALLQLDPERIYAVDYLLAEPNRRPMSRWGHSMLRLVICAPGRPRGPDCRLDLSEHRVISFRAFVDDVQVSSWRGLTGDYPSRLYVLPLQQVVDEYTRVELRGLRSLPLRLDRGEIAAIARRAAQLHWSYDGRYYFLGNNCALETWRLLHDASPRLAALPLASIRPNVLARRLQRAGVADASVLDDAAQARRLGYRFDSASDDYQAMFEVVRAALPVRQGDAEQWLASPPARRGQWIERADLRAAAAMLLLEQAAWQKQQARMRETLKRRLLRAGGDTDAVAAEFRALLQQEGMLAQPAALLQAAGYGLPQPAELASRETAMRAQQVRDGWRSLRGQAEELLPGTERATLAGIDGNLEAIGQRLRRLHTESGGLELPRDPSDPQGRP
ncbi:DUF4105 domain-containing protein [Stenotrophomonas sp. MMGLT7]|uniref:DUF7844 domain-containing protein n=1 Tax=Stenotrophomonas sp. MMGLT7 TaxID=2901227 RepID=UPI001E4695A0|nr:DUF4105 domain-containing protein [Stenotrophomonas sp. MMGLT7]MCD7097133.1 DUF4105 domain-containing protein [Stenotrophomonas sp. MMGLT7]